MKADCKGRMGQTNECKPMINSIGIGDFHGGAGHQRLMSPLGLLGLEPGAFFIIRKFRASHITKGSPVNSHGSSGALISASEQSRRPTASNLKAKQCERKKEQAARSTGGVKVRRSWAEEGRRAQSAGVLAGGALYIGR